MVEGRILLDRAAFVGHSFDESDADVVEFFKSLLSEMSVKCLSGERAAAQSISDKVKDRIKEADVFVGVFTRREKIEGKNEWNTSAWLIDEKAHAQALGKKLILLKETGVVSIGGLQGDYEYVEFDRERLHKAALLLVQTVWSLNPGKLSLNRHGPPGMSVEVLEAAIAAQPDEPLLRVMLAQHRVTSGRLDGAIRELQAVLLTHPDFVPARMALAKGMSGLGRNGEALQVMDRLIKSNPLSAMVHHQKAHILENTGDIEGAEEAFQTSIDCDPSRASYHRCLGQFMLRTAKDSASRLQEAKEALEMAVTLGGSNERQSCRGYLQTIKRKLKKKAPTRKAVKKTQKRKRRSAKS